MTRSRILFPIGLSVLLLAALPALASDAPTARPPEEFRANLVDTANLVPGAASAFFRLHIDEYADPAATENMLELLRDEGQQGLRERLDNQEIGWVQIGAANVSYPVSFARTFEDNGDRVVRAIVARPMGFVETIQNWRTTEYPFSVVELRLDEEGRGSGVFVLATQLRFNPEGDLVVENYTYAPFHLLNVREVSTD